MPDSDSELAARIRFDEAEARYVELAATFGDDMPSREDIVALTEAHTEDKASMGRKGDAFFTELCRENGWQRK